MQVNLIKEAEFDFKTEKYSNIPFETFVNLVELGVIKDNYKKEMAQVQLFENVADFKRNYEAGVYDESKGVYIMNNGKILMFLKQPETTSPKTSTVAQGTDKDNESADTKENPAKKA